MNKLSVAIIAYNEERVIADAIKSASFADEVVVVDSASTDKTVSIAEQAGARVHHQAWLGFGLQKQRAVELCSNDWIFVLDADERITPELASELQELLAGHPPQEGYQVARLNYFFGKPIRHCGLYPDYTVRFFNRKYGRFSSDAVHERVEIKTVPGTMKNHMEHLAYDSVKQFIDKQNRYSSLNAKNSLVKAIIRPPWTFIRIYLLKRGFMDGRQGLIIALLYSQYTFWKYIKTDAS